MDGKHGVALGEISILQSGPESWDVGVRTFLQTVESTSSLERLESESALDAWVSRARHSFDPKDGWFEYTGHSLRLLVNKNHSDFVEIAILQDQSPKYNMSVRNFSDGVETHREVLSFPSDSKRHAARNQVLQELSPENGWYTFSTHLGWEALPEKTSLPIVTYYVRVLGVFEDNYDFPEISNRNEAKGRAEIEFADYSVIDRTTDQVFSFEKVDTKTKAVKADDGTTYMEASVVGMWWSDYYPVEAVCEGEAQKLFLDANSDRFSVVGAWDPNDSFQFGRLEPQSTRIIQSSNLPLGLEWKLEKIQKLESPDFTFNEVDLEWLFFGALGFQQEVRFQQEADVLPMPAIDYGESGTDFFEKWGRPNFGSEVGFFWPANQLLSREEESFLLDLFLRYRLLWNGEPVYGDLLTLEVFVDFRIEYLADSKVRESISEKLNVQNWGQHSFLAKETLGLLNDQSIYGA